MKVEREVCVNCGHIEDFHLERISGAVQCVCGHEIRYYSKVNGYKETLKPTKEGCSCTKFEP